jgi:hypothetical protein
MKLIPRQPCIIEAHVYAGGYLTVFHIHAQIRKLDASNDTTLPKLPVTQVLGRLRSEVCNSEYSFKRITFFARCATSQFPGFDGAR